MTFVKCLKLMLDTKSWKIIPGDLPEIEHVDGYYIFWHPKFGAVYDRVSVGAIYDPLLIPWTILNWMARILYWRLNK